eukprot:gnl/MRDRNA2_/MRDRNA2_141268_c0_seq1.p1 gnl/MRDRNA2_/MRDRNA2_141268_c0~~gnl/MRDRNA2_/MRDRNA2_141268_c0_seq1.p1  ORF type:complete len:450 (+),score=75.85 gnl/MRDRNA2_/MRDRNA2_141268_c0_seq1:100-1350(+)
MSLECCEAQELNAAIGNLGCWNLLRSLELVECRMNAASWSLLRSLPSLSRFAFSGSGTTQLVPPEEWTFGSSLREFSISPLGFAPQSDCWSSLFRGCPRLQVLNVHAMDTRAVVKELAEEAAHLPLQLRVLSLSPRDEVSNIDQQTLQYKGLLVDEDISTVVSIFGHCLEVLLLAGQVALTTRTIKTLRGCSQLQVLSIRRCFLLELPESQSTAEKKIEHENSQNIQEVFDEEWLPAAIVESSSPKEMYPKFFFRSSQSTAFAMCNIEHGKCLKVQLGVHLIDPISGNLRLQNLVSANNQSNRSNQARAGLLGWAGGTPPGIRQLQQAAQCHRYGTYSAKDVNKIHEWCRKQMESQDVQEGVESNPSSPSGASAGSVSPAGGNVFQGPYPGQRSALTSIERQDKRAAEYLSKMQIW